MFSSSFKSFCVEWNDRSIQLMHRNGLSKRSSDIYSNKRVIDGTRSIHKKDKSNLLCIHLIANEDDMYDNVTWRAFTY